MGEKTLVESQIADSIELIKHLDASGYQPSLGVWYYYDDQLLAIDSMNEPRSYAFGRKIIEAGKNPTPAKVADPATDLKALAKD